MPMIDVYAARDLFPPDADRPLGEALTLALLRAEGVATPGAFHLNNTAAYIHRLQPSAVQTAASADIRGPQSGTAYLGDLERSSRGWLGNAGYSLRRRGICHIGRQGAHCEVTSPAVWKPPTLRTLALREACRYSARINIPRRRTFRWCWPIG